MTPDPLDLWPEDIQVAPLTPLRILRFQADRLKDKTQGRLTVEIHSSGKGSPVPKPDDWGDTLVHRFEIVAKALDNYRHQLVVCVHQKEFAYPVQVIGWGVPEEDDGTLASSQEEFTNAIKKILNSKQTVGVISSLLARIAESDGSQPAA